MGLESGDGRIQLLIASVRARRRCMSLAVAIVALTWLVVVVAPASAITWSPPTNVDGITDILSASCPSVSLCVLSDSVANVVTSTNPTGGTSAWTTAYYADSFAGTPTINGMSCVTSPSTACAGDDALGNIITSTDPTGGASAWNVVTPTDPDGGVGALIFWGMSCTSSESPLCVAVGDDSKGPALFTSSGPSVNAGAWALTQLEGPGNTNHDGWLGNTLYDVSCPAASLCVAGSGDGELAVSTDPTGGYLNWSQDVIQSGGGNLGGTVLGVSCASTTLCVATDGSDVIWSNTPTGGAGMWNVVDADPGHNLNGISCTASPTLFCAAVDDNGDVVTSTDPTGTASSWTVTDVDGTTSLPAVSCATASLCVLADASGNVITPLVTQTLTVDRIGAGSGTVTSSPVGITCPSACSHAFDQGTSVTLTAAAASGSTFGGWSGGGCAGTGTCTLTLNSAATVSATFNKATIPPPKKKPSGTKITKATVKKTDITFTFKASNATGYQCGLVAIAKKGKPQQKLKYKSCKSPKEYKHLKKGKYSFSVRGIDSAGADPHPAGKSFTIK